LVVKKLAFSQLNASPIENIVFFIYYIGCATHTHLIFLRYAFPHYNLHACLFRTFISALIPNLSISWSISWLEKSPTFLRQTYTFVVQSSPFASTCYSIIQMQRISNFFSTFIKIVVLLQNKTITLFPDIA